MKLIYYRNLSSTKVYCYKPPDPAGPAGPAGPGAPVEPAKIEILQQLEHSSPVYTMQPVVKRLHRVYSRLSNRLYNPVWQPCWTNSHFSFNRLSKRVVQPVWQTGLYNRFDNRLYRVYKHSTGC